MTLTTWTRDGFLISTDSSLISPAVLNKAFASDQLYWASSLPEPAMFEMLENSLCFGLYSPTPSPPPAPANELQSEIAPDPADTLHEIAGHVRPEAGQPNGTDSQTYNTTTAMASQPLTSTTQETTPSLIGFARLITDRITFAYLTDVYILPEWQGQGLGKWLTSCVQEIIDEMPYLRRSMCLTGGSPRTTQFYKEGMKMDPLVAPLTPLVSHQALSEPWYFLLSGDRCWHKAGVARYLCPERCADVVVTELERSWEYVLVDFLVESRVVQLYVASFRPPLLGIHMIQVSAPHTSERNCSCPVHRSAIVTALCRESRIEGSTRERNLHPERLDSSVSSNEQPSSLGLCPDVYGRPTT
jgi:hypothetical protein